MFSVSDSLWHEVNEITSLLRSRGELRSKPADCWSAPCFCGRLFDRDRQAVLPQTFQRLVDLIRRLADLTLHLRIVNWEPGLVVKQDGVTISVLAFAFAGDRISHIWAVRNPEKLHAWTED